MKQAEQKWYVDPVDGDDSNDGSESAPLRTFAELDRRLGPGAVNYPLVICTVADRKAPKGQFG